MDCLYDAGRASERRACTWGTVVTALITRSVRGAATTLAILLTTASASIVALPAARAAAASPSVPVIIDTDMYSNSDDVGALAVCLRTAATQER